MTAELKAVHPRDAMAALFARGKTLDPSFAWQDVWQAEHARAFTVAKSAGFDILSEIHAALTRALGEGRTFRDFSGELTPLLQAKGWWGRQLVDDPATGERVVAQLGSPRRLQTIFDVNMRVSYATGHWASFERNKAAWPFLRYVCILDDVTRPEHRARHNLVLPVDHPYWDVWAPPCGWNCRCTLQSLSQRDIDRLIGDGVPLFFDPPADTFRSYVNRRTGEVSRVPDGIDPGWAYNPGKAGQSVLPIAEKLIDAPPKLAAGLYADPDWLLNPLDRDFERWFDLAAAGERVDRSIVAAGALTDAVLSALGGMGITPASPAITITQATVGHLVRDSKTAAGRAAPLAVLRRLPDLLASPRGVLRDKRDGALLYVYDVPGEARRGKLVVRLDFSERFRPPGGKKQAIVTNSVRSAGLVDEISLRDRTFYEVLWEG